MWAKKPLPHGRALQPSHYLLIDGSGILWEVSVQRDCRLEFLSDSTEGNLKGSRALAGDYYISFLSELNYSL